MRTALALLAFLGLMTLVGSIEASGNPILSQPLSAEAAGQPRPCYRHHEFTEPTKRECLRNYWRARRAAEKQARRDRMDWPPRPTVKEIKRRVGIAQWRKAERVAYCETAGNWNHYPRGNYIGGLGMFRRTYGIGRAVTRYRWVHEGATKQEQIAIGYVVAQRYGWSAWGCGGA